MNVCGIDVRIQGRLVRTARLELDKYEFLDDPNTMVETLKALGTRIDIFHFLQRLPETLDPNPDTSPKYGYPMIWDNLAVLPVSTYDHWWNHQIRNAPRGRVRTAEKKGITVGEVPFDDALVCGIQQIYNECPLRQGKPFTHYGEDLATVRREAETFLERSVFAGAFLDRQMIGFTKLVMDDRRAQACLMHIVSMVQHKDKAASNVLIAQAVRSCAERNIRYLVYQNFGYGNKQHDSLSDFKERNGFRRVDLPRYYVPLTATGRLALHLGLHRKLADRLPESVIAKLRDLRTTWYNRKFQSA
jgi:hypothetical protein